MFRKILAICLVFIFLFPKCTDKLQAESEFYIRLNQIGFLPQDVKSAVILSYKELEGKRYLVKESKSNKSVFANKIKEKNTIYGSFKYTYNIDFSEVKANGEYFIEIDGKKSYTFAIGDDVYNNIAESLLDFFKVQRCGYTEPLMHDVCHIADATSIIDGKNKIDSKIDVTGGWHDAGDYVKFLNTTAYATYMLLFAYDFNENKFNFDNNKNNIPDILEEAKIGLDWMLRCYISDSKLITQVQDLRDHDVGWRLPEKDPLAFDRPAYVGIGKNLIGIYSATMGLASKIWKEKIRYPEFADQCLQIAEKLYANRNSVPDIDSSGSGMYIDKVFKGKLALGAIELFYATNKMNYYKDAVDYANSAGSDYWWSWGDINSLAHYRLAKFDLQFADYIKNNLELFNQNKDGNLFGKGTSLSWGTNNTLLGVTLQKILWKRLTNDAKFDTLASYQKDFILGRNPWGISLIYGKGKNFTTNFHHQIAKIKGKLPGGFAAGPATKEFMKNYNIPYERPDQYSKFQTEDVFYRDDYMDYVTNEPTITANATAIFVFGNLKK